MKIRILMALALLSGMLHAGSDTEDYINKYKKVAIREMKAYGIPASITLAQGILESGSGKSYLAREANNHFGIKCHEDWKGKRVYHDDDERNECFRSYKDPYESFRDHSEFLTTRSRYAFLFEESPTDYKAWARGLKKAGYATNRKYPQLLIDLIERYELHKYDLEGFNEKSLAGKDEEKSEAEIELYQLQVSSNRVKYIVAMEGDSFETIAVNTQQRVHKLLEYNDMSYDDKIKAGARIYTQPKRRKAAREHEHHTVKQGETMYSIFQQFGVRLRYLYKWNNMPVGSQPFVGQVLKLR